MADLVEVAEITLNQDSLPINFSLANLDKFIEEDKSSKAAQKKLQKAIQNISSIKSPIQTRPKGKNKAKDILLNNLT